MKPSQRIIGMLEELGFRHAQLIPAQGWYRTSPRSDAYRWTGFAQYGGTRVSLVSFSQMTDCARYGVTVAAEDRVQHVFAVDAKLTKAKA